jgi:hypothetical protein
MRPLDVLIECVRDGNPSNRAIAERVIRSIIGKVPVCELSGDNIQDVDHLIRVMRGDSLG